MGIQYWKLGRKFHIERFSYIVEKSEGGYSIWESGQYYRLYAGIVPPRDFTGRAVPSGIYYPDGI